MIPFNYISTLTIKLNHLTKELSCCAKSHQIPPSPLDSFCNRGNNSPFVDTYLGILNETHARNPAFF